MEYTTFTARLANEGVSFSSTDYFSEYYGPSKTWVDPNSPWYPEGTGAGTASNTFEINPLPQSFQLVPPESIDLEKLKKHFVALQDVIINLFKAGDLNQATFFALVKEIQRMECVLLGLPAPAQEAPEQDEP